MARPGQLVYLPNAGDHYEFRIIEGEPLTLTADHPIIRQREATRKVRAKAEREAKEAREKRMAERKARAKTGDASPVDAFNAAHSIADLLERYGYQRDGQSNDWRSPMQESGSYATRDYGGYWLSLSDSDAAAGIGAATKGGCRHGDAFDLYVHHEHGGDFNAAVAAYGAEIRPNRSRDGGAGQSDAPEGKEGTNTEATPAADPVDLWGSFDPPELPPGLLPPILEQFARANGDQMGADPSGLALAALVTCAAAIPDQVTIKVKRHGDWTESPRIWVVLVGSPSTKKTPIISAATCPLCAIDMRLAREYQEKAAAYAALPKEEKKGKAPPLQTRLRLEDTTVEAAQQVLEGSPWGVLLLQDELTAFFGSMDRYTSGKAAQADRAFWLRTFNGGPFAWNRVGRGTGIIDNLSMSLLGGIQPEPLRKIAGDSVDDGLLQRLFPIMLRTATMGRDEPMPPINEQYRTLIECLHRLRLPGFFGCHLEFDDGAQRIRRELEARHLELQSTETVSGKLASHVGKYDGLFARLCIVAYFGEFALAFRLKAPTRFGDFAHL